MITDDELTAFLAKRDKASPLPWKCDHNWRRVNNNPDAEYFAWAETPLIRGGSLGEVLPQAEADRDYAEAAANAAPEFAEEVMRLRKVINAAHAVLTRQMAEPLTSRGDTNAIVEAITWLETALKGGEE